MHMPDPATLPLRNQILDACSDGYSVDVAARALTESLMILLIARAPDADACERAVHAVAHEMITNVRRAHEEYHAMKAGLTETRQ
jgi:hypothetical protein